MASPNGIITLLTDFGLEDVYVGIMKGVILGIAPRARLVDLSHGIPPQAVAEGAYLLHASYRFFPPGTVHVAVVDPGVGSERHAVALGTPEAIFVGPDNGLFAPVAAESRERFGEEVAIVELAEPRYWLPRVSATFHGRDIFAPVAAHIVNGVPLADLGPHLDSLMPGPGVLALPGAGGTLLGQVVHIDHFGNCITNITRDQLARRGIADHLVVELGGHTIPGLYRTYSDGTPGLPLALMSSSGHLEIALPNGNAAQTLGITRGQEVRIVPRGET